MLAVRDRRRQAWSVELIVVALWLLTLYGAIATGQPLLLVISLVLGAWAVGTARLVERVGSDIVVRRPFARARRFPAHRCAFGWRTQGGGRGRMYWVYLTDGTATIDIAPYLLAAQAEQTAGRLEATLVDGAGGGAARARVEADRTAHRTATELGRAHNDDFWRDPRHRLLVAVVIVTVLVYSLVAFLIWEL